MNKENENANEQIILQAFKTQLKVHLCLKDKTFRNGIIKKIENDFFIIDDLQNGEEPIFFLQVYDISPFMENKLEGDKDDKSNR